MSFVDDALKFIASRLHIPGDVLDYYFASRHVGRKAATALAFPAELIPLGARLVARGWLNEKFFPTHLDWVLPYWAERQFDPADPAFIPPAGFNLYTINQTHRDWTMIGNLDRAREAIVDPRGLVTPWFDGWSLDVWVEVGGRLYAPSRLPDSQVEQSLAENLPIVVTTFRAEGLSVRTEAFAVEDEATGGEWVVDEVLVENLTAGIQRGMLYIAVRPFNPEGVSLVKKIEYKPAKMEEAVQAGRHETGGNGSGAAPGTAVFLVNDALGVILPRADAVACSDEEAGDVALALPEVNGRTSASSEAGLATAVAAYAFELRGGETRRIAARMPMERQPYDKEGHAADVPVIAVRPAEKLRAQAVTAWQGKLRQGMRVRLPDDKLQNAFEANKAFLLLLDDDQTITPGPFTYHQFWFRDAAFLLNALDKLGYHAEARKIIDVFPRRLQKDGYLSGTEGEWDANGEAIWAMVENARLSGERDLLAKHYWSLLRIASWINSKRRQTMGERRAKDSGAKPSHHGLLPPGPSAEHLGPNDYYYWDDFWGLAGLRDAARVAEWMGQTDDAARLYENFASFRGDVDASLAAAAARLGRPAMPASPYRRLDAGIIGNLAALYPLHLFEPNDPRIGDTLAALKEKAWAEDAYFSHVGHSAFGTYLSLHVAQCYLFQRNPEAWKIIDWVLHHASPTFAWAEGLHPITHRGGMGDGHHGWAVADFLLIVRDLLLFEEDDHLVLTPILKPEWTAENNVVKVEGAPTYFGNLSFTIAFGERTATLVMTSDWRTAPAYIDWYLPFPVREAGAEPEQPAAEIAENRVRLAPQTRRAVAMW